MGDSYDDKELLFCNESLPADSCYQDDQGDGGSEDSPMRANSLNRQAPLPRARLMKKARYRNTVDPTDQLPNQQQTEQASSSLSNDAISDPQASMKHLPTPTLRVIGDFVGKKTPFNDCCRATIEAFRELHYTVNIEEMALIFGSVHDPSEQLSARHMGLFDQKQKRPTTSTSTGRVITRITVTGCTDRKNSNGGYQLLEKAVKRVVLESVPTLRSITVTGRRGKDSGRVAAIFAGFLGKKQSVASKLKHVRIEHGANAVVKAGKAISAGLWPALEELIVSHCHANRGHMKHIADALKEGSAPNLRVLDWGDQAVGSSMAEMMLSALSQGKCSRIESLEFSGAFVLYDPSMSHLTDALRACPELRSLRMDCSTTPDDQLRDLIAALKAGISRKLQTLFVRSFHSFFAGSHRGVSSTLIAELKREAASRSPPIALKC